MSSNSTENDPLPLMLRRVMPGVAYVGVSSADGNGNGSGFAPTVDSAMPDGFNGTLVVTNAHVVNHPSAEFVVRFAGGYDVVPEVVMVDSVTDVAFLVVDERPDTTLELRNSDDLHVGEQAIAIGSPFNFEGSVSAGIVTGDDRSLRSDGEDRILGDLVQTDALILPGNSGGPLVDRFGRVIGMNTIAVTRAMVNGGGIFFAVSSATIVAHLREFLAFGDREIRRASIGASVGTARFDAASQRRWLQLAGVKLVRVADSGPASDAGLLPGDVIVEFCGRVVDHHHDLQLSLNRFLIGESCAISFVRGEERHETTLVPVEKR